MTENKTSEMRRFSRFRQKLEVKYTPVKPSEGQSKSAMCDDIGYGGMRMLVSESMRVGQRLRFAFRCRESTSWSPETEGIITWQTTEPSSNEKSFLTGIYFSAEQAQINNYLQDLLSSNLKDASDTGWRFSDNQIESAYDGSKVTFKLLRLFGWGPLNNLGYFSFPSPFGWLNMVASFCCRKLLYILPTAQRRLIIRSIRLLHIQKGEKVLDIACGKGMSSFLLSSIHPDSLVTGIDILPRNISAARSLYGGVHNLRYLIDDAMKMTHRNNSMDKMMCVEAAFHFPDRTQFIREAYRVLRPGGQIVIVDFMWKSEGSRLRDTDPQAQLVKSEWEWTDFNSIEQYLVSSKNVGFKIIAEKNWSSHVTGPLESTFMILALLGSIKIGRRILIMLNPALQCLSDREWGQIYLSAMAHNYVRKRVKYTALILQKPDLG